MVVLVSEFTSVHLGVSNQLLTVLGLVLGLVISFRTSSAYERCVQTRIIVQENIHHASDFIGIKKARNYGLQSCILRDTWHSWYVLKLLPLLYLRDTTDLGACPSYSHNKHIGV